MSNYDWREERDRLRRMTQAGLSDVAAAQAECLTALDRCYTDHTYLRTALTGLEETVRESVAAAEKLHAMLVVEDRAAWLQRKKDEACDAYVNAGFASGEAMRAPMSPTYAADAQNAMQACVAAHTRMEQAVHEYVKHMTDNPAYAHWLRSKVVVK